MKLRKKYSIMPIARTRMIIFHQVRKCLLCRNSPPMTINEKKNDWRKDDATIICSSSVLFRSFLIADMIIKNKPSKVKKTLE